MIRKIINDVVKQRTMARRVDLYKNLIRHEAKIGGELFGPLKPGARREFFCLDEKTWVWHEEWLDGAGQRHIKTTRYDVRQDDIVKVQDGIYRSVSFQEADRLRQAIELYSKRVNNELYRFVS